MKGGGNLEQSDWVLENFVVLEGLDGAGTTTQLGRLEERLEDLKVPHHCTFEPTEGAIGRLIRDFLKGRASFEPQTAALLFAADRNEHIRADGGILSRIEKGELVVSDRYLFSSLAYQGIECGLSWVRALNRQFPLPQHLFFLDTPAEVSQSRIAHRRSREFFERLEFQKKVRNAYWDGINLFKESPMHVHCIDGSGSPQQIFDQLWSVLKNLPILRT
jgi:dTMP kinase